MTLGIMTSIYKQILPLSHRTAVLQAAACRIYSTSVKLTAY